MTLNVKARLFLVLALLGLLSTALAAVQAESVPLKAFLSAPFPAHLTASPSGRVLAWVFNREGRRDIWMAESPDFNPRRLTNSTEDDGQDIPEISFSADESVIIFVRGGEANRTGENPNPNSNPAGAEQAVWAVKVRGGAPWRLGPGRGLVASPSENSVVFSQSGQLFHCLLEDKPEPQPLFKARGTIVQPVFSPDGTKLAFVSYRRDHSFVGVYDRKAGLVRWISPSVDQDGYPEWAPDGRRLAFFRFPGGQDPMGIFRSGETFSLMVADLDSGETREVWRCPNETGGFAQDYVARPLFWGADDHLAFFSEHEGWMHLYAVSLRSGKLISLTPGAFEVEDCCLSSDRTALVFNSNQADIDRRHLWSVPVVGGAPKPLTQGQGLEWSPVPAENGRAIAFLCSTATQPASPALMKLGQKEWRLLARKEIPAAFSASVLVEPRQVVFRAPDGLEIHGQLFLPRGAGPGDGRAAVIFMHGGPIRQMLLGWHMRSYYHNAYAFNQYLCHKGYVVLSVNFRSGLGYGFAFRNAAGYGWRGASEYQDIVAAAKFLQTRPEVNPGRIGLWGGSYGGYLTALGLARDSELFAAGVDLHGVHDWAGWGEMRFGEEFGSRRTELQQKAKDSSPVADVDFWTSPVLFIHGDDDRNVEFAQTTEMVQLLRKLGKAPVELLVFPDEVHSFLLHARWLEAFRAAADFFDRRLRAPMKNGKE